MPQLIQYLCPSWRLSLYGRPSALSRWSDRPVLQYDRAQLVRLSLEEDSTESVAWEGSAQELQELQDILQNYIQDLLQRSHQVFLAAEQGVGLESSESIVPIEAIGESSLVVQGLTDHGLTAQSSTDHSLTGQSLMEQGFTEQTLIQHDRPDLTEQDLTEQVKEQENDSESNVVPLPLMRLDSVGALTHRLFLPPQTTLVLSTLECFDLADVLDQWQTETLNLPNLAPASPPSSLVPALRTAALILVTMGLSTSASLLGVYWWQQQQNRTIALQSAKTEALPPLSAPSQGLTQSPNQSNDRSNYVPIPRLPSEVYGPPAPSQVYGPPVPGQQTSVAMGIELQGEQPLPHSDFAGLPAPPPPNFGPLPPPPAYSGDSGSYPPASVPESGGNVYISSLPDRPSADLAPAPAVNQPRSSGEAPASESRVSLSAEASSDNAAPAAPPAEKSNVDESARIASIAGYFQSRWQPVDHLTAALEYRVSIGADGTVQSISPLSDRAGTFIDRTGMPLVGEALTTPGQSLTVTIVLYPKGGVDVIP